MNFTLCPEWKCLLVALPANLLGGGEGGRAGETSPNNFHLTCKLHPVTLNYNLWCCIQIILPINWLDFSSLESSPGCLSIWVCQHMYRKSSGQILILPVPSLPSVQVPNSIPSQLIVDCMFINFYCFPYCNTSLWDLRLFTLLFCISESSMRILTLLKHER